jgi:Mce-associated membrane protein
MAKHAGAAEKAEPVDESIDLDSTAEEIDTKEADEAAGDGAENAEPRKRRVPDWLSRTPAPIAVGIGAVVALLGVGGWLGFRLHQDHQVQDQRSLYVQVARQTAINLTTINYAEVDADIKRVLDSATGGFHDEFQNRSQPFVEVVKKVQSKTEGTIAEAGLLSYTKEQAQVLVAISVKTSMGTAPADQEPRRWRMRLTVNKVGDGAKVSNVEFVP